METRMTIGTGDIPRCGPLAVTEYLALSVCDRAFWRDSAAR
jgi:hypothetical protein